MLSLYLKSIVLYWIILFASLKMVKMSMKMNNINLEDYVGKKSGGKPSLIIIAAIPIFRFAMFLMCLLLIVCSKETLDKIFKKEKIGEEKDITK